MTNAERVIAAAKALWELGELELPHRTRLRWEDGSVLARAACFARAIASLDAAYPENKPHDP